MGDIAYRARSESGRYALGFDLARDGGDHSCISVIDMATGQCAIVQYIDPNFQIIMDKIRGTEAVGRFAPMSLDGFTI